MQLSNEPPKWEDVAGNFYLEFSGELADLYVRSPPLNGWDALLQLVREKSYPTLFIVDGIGGPVPEHYLEIPEVARHNFNVFLEFKVGAATVDVHFFLPDEIEISVHAWEVREAATYEGLCEFIRCLGDRLDRPVIWVEELDPENEFLTYRPTEPHWEYRENRRSTAQP